MTHKGKNYDIFNGDKFIESMRSSGFKDTSYAVAEIVDNSIDAGAKHVEIVCKEKINHITNRYFLDQIAILDDGDGMSSDELRSALLFGDGTRGQNQNQNEIGKYGMGLPNSSLSQCKKVEIYSWQKSATPFYTYLDVDEVKKGKRQIPSPRSTDIPEVWKKAAKQISKKSGTLVIWSKLDRCSWTTSKKIMEHSTFLLGRIYRRFLNKKNIVIGLTTIKIDDSDEITHKNSKPMLLNDPMYLMTPSSAPGKWGKEPMFKPDTVPEESYFIDYEGQKHRIVVRYSIERNELRSDAHGDQGSTLHGKHARKNIGVSIMRADREITLDTSILTSIDVRDRWWGIEMDIPPSLDLAVGLTNNKQRTDALSAMMNMISQFGDDASDQNVIEEQLSEHDKTSIQMFEMVRKVRARIRSMQSRIRIARKDTRSKAGKTGIGAKIDRGIAQDQKGGKKSQSDRDRENTEEGQRTKQISTTLQSEGKDETEAKKIATQWVENDEKIIFESATLDGKQFFSVQNTGGVLRIKINHEHRAYQNLLALTETDGNKDLDVKDRLTLTRHGLWLLLASWGRYEDLIENIDDRQKVQDIRYQWGKELDTFLEQNDI